MNPEEWAEKQAARRKQWREKAKASYHHDRRHKVYLFEFGDGWQYVGVTVMPYDHRIRAHRKDCSVVGRRIDLGQDWTLYELGAFDDRAEAERFEAEQIAAIPKGKRLNVLSPVEDWKLNG